MSRTSLVGHWKIVGDSSDLVPGIDSIIACPWSGLLNHSASSSEFLLIEARKADVIEEFSITFRSSTSRSTNPEHSALYKMGTTSFLQHGDRRRLAIAEDVSTSFDRFCITTLGPKMGQRSTESFQLSADGNSVCVTVDMWFDNEKMPFTRYLSRITSSSGVQPTPAFTRCLCTRGWRNNGHRSASLLDQLLMSMQLVVKLGSYTPSREPSSESSVSTIAHIMERYREDPSNKPSLAVFIIQVSFGSCRWIVGHRYSEFESLKKMCPPSREGPPFPKKSFGTTGETETRRRSLEIYLSYLLQNRGFDEPNLVMALLSFLEVPEQLQAHSDRQAAILAASLPPEPPKVTESKPTKSAPAATPNPTTTTASTATGSAAAVTGAAAATAVAGASESKPTKQHRKSIFGAFSASSAAPSSSTSTSSNDDVTAKTPAPAATATTASVSSPTPSSQPTPAVTTKTNAPPVVAPSGGAAVKPTPAKAAISTSQTSSASTASASTSVAANTTTTAATATPAPAADSSRLRTTTTRPQDSLYELLREGVVVLKHGRQGLPKKRLLRCDHAISRVYWDKAPDGKSKALAGLTADLPTEDKSVLIAEVTNVRRGTDPDAEDPNKRGTATLRRNCKPADLALCFSLILPSRTFDIQCLSQDDYNNLYTNFDLLVKKMRA